MKDNTKILTPEEVEAASGGLIRRTIIEGRTYLSCINQKTGEIMGRIPVNYPGSNPKDDFAAWKALTTLDSETNSK